MADGEIHLKSGTVIEFEIEQNPEDDSIWGVWEKISTSPEDDEIVDSFSTEELCKQWIQRQLLDPETYARSRGIE